jgi:hypothetical protein
MIFGGIKVGTLLGVGGLIYQGGSQDVFFEADGSARIDHAVQRSKLICDQIRWTCSKYAPKVYGSAPAAEDAAPQGLTISWMQTDAAPVPPPPREPPKQLVCRQPEPGALTAADWAALMPVLDLIKRTIPSNSDTPPAEIFEIIRKALLAHFKEDA